jgi:hypothetical protein
MSLTEFRELPFGPQMNLLARDGIPLLSRSPGGERRVLFSFDTYFVEAGWDQAGRLQFVRSFAHTSGLDPYLAQLDWHELA